MKTILITGIFGNIGYFIAEKLLNEGYNVIGFDILSRSNKKNQKKLNKRLGQHKKNFAHHWGDITNLETIQNVFSLELIDAVVHNAFIIPPISEINPDLAKKVNINGTRNLLKVVENYDREINFLFSSSVATYGHHPFESVEVNPTDELTTFNTYSDHKIECENLLTSSSINWRILKYSAIMNPFYAQVDSISRAYARTIHPKTKVQPIHVLDLALAVSNSIFNPQADKKVFIIAGPESNRMRYKDYLWIILNSIKSIDPKDIPWDTFNGKGYYLHWYDTTESEKLLKFQQRSVEEFASELHEETPLYYKFLVKLIPKSLYIKISFGLFPKKIKI